MILGWVYVLSNSAMPGLVKIGQSAADPALRAAVLHTTGVPRPFTVEYKGLFADFARIERLAHAAFAERRDTAQREFFRLTAEAAVAKIRLLSDHPPHFEVCNFEIPETKSRSVSDWAPTPKSDAPWIAAERERRRLHRLSDHLEPAGLRFINCRVCGGVVRSSQRRCDRCKTELSAEE